MLRESSATRLLDSFAWRCCARRSSAEAWPGAAPREMVSRSADAPAADHDEALQYLTFALGSEMFASDIRGIKEIIEYAGLTTVPMMPVVKPML